MSAVLDIGVWVLIAIVVAALALAALRWRKSLGGARSETRPVQAGQAALPGMRLAVLESADVDEARRLVLVRCDGVEHLLLVGGPADLVVDHDVRQNRAARPGPQPARPAPGAARPAAPAPQKPADAQPRRPGRPPEGGPRAADPLRAKATGENAAERAPRPPLTAVPAPVKNGHAASPAARVELERPARPPAAEAARPEAAPPIAPAPVALRPAAAPGPSAPGAETPRPRAVEPPGMRREPVLAPPPRPAPARPVVLVDDEAQSPAAPATERRAAPEPQAVERRAPAEPAPLPQPAHLPQPEAHSGRAAEDAAETAWPEADSIEGEIVRALRVGEDRPAPQPEASPSPAAAASLRPAATVSPATTLGDLAERLEEALAREVKAASRSRGVFAPEHHDGSAAAPRAAEAREPAAPTVRAEERRTADMEPERTAAPESERRDWRAERQEEAPVISLHSRRREPADPLEDEMARLLGELTGDTSRR